MQIAIHPTTARPTMPETTRVFISYSHDSEDHKQLVLGLANQLRAQGIDSNLDQYEESPGDGWILWMEKEIDLSQYVIIICTKGYSDKWTDTVSGYGKGVKWEGAILSQEIYELKGKNSRFIPAVFYDKDKQYIPRILKPYTYYNVMTEDGYERLYRRLTRQPTVRKPTIGKLIQFPSKKKEGNPIAFSDPKGDPKISQSIQGNNNIQVGILSGNIKITTPRKPALLVMPVSGTIGANVLLKQAIKDRFDKLGEEREKRFGKSAYAAMYLKFKLDFGIKKKEKWSVIWDWPEAAAQKIVEYLDLKYANTKAGRIDNSIQRGSLMPTKGQLFQRERELLSQLDLDISSEQVRTALMTYFGVDSHTKLDRLKHWQWVVYLEKVVKDRIGE